MYFKLSVAMLLGVGVGLFTRGLSPATLIVRAASGPPVAGQQYCSTAFPGNVGVAFNWISSNEGTEWLDLSLADNGFAPGTFVSAGPLASGTGSFFWDGLMPGRTHFVRVNTFTTGGWQPSATSSFQTGVCQGPTPATPGTVSSGCAEGILLGTFYWSTAQPQGQVQWLDLSLQDNGFAPGTFVSAGPLDGSRTSFLWTGLLGGARHFWRVNTWTGAGWVTSGTGSFTAGYCQAPPPLPTPPPGSGPLTLADIDGRAVLIADDGTYLGLVSSNQYDPASICDPYGTYGSKYSTGSVRDPYGTYGSAYSSQGAYSPYTNTPPAIIYNRTRVGFLTKNPYLPGAVDPDVLFAVYGCAN